MRNTRLLTCLIVFALTSCTPIKPWSKSRGYARSSSSYGEKEDTLSKFPNIVSLAEKGLAPAQFNLGDIYLEGDGVEQDYALAAKWHRKAAKQGFPMSQYRLGTLYAEGKGVEQDQAEADIWLGKAAQGGVTQSNNDAKDNDVVETEAKLADGLNQSADLGDAAAQYKLGSMYFLGNGVPKDLVLSYMWLKLAARHGSEDAKRDRNFVSDKMTAVQKEQAVKLFNKWLRDHQEK